MAVIIVEGLEVIDVEQDQRKRLARLRVALNLLRQDHIEMAAIGNLGQPVRDAEPVDFLVQGFHPRFGHLALGNVAHDGAIILPAAEADIMRRDLDRTAWPDLLVLVLSILMTPTRFSSSQWRYQ